ncbi:MAG: hypothetical protein EBT03_11955 [Betaproteobacteria bacterium]|nr:hypothetical protein [Betaproteobacteria bacterium]
MLGDLANTASVTFSGIYAAIAEGDLAGAMDVLWAGLYAGWLRGVEALMGAVDPFISTLQGAFDYVAASILFAWDGLVNGLAAMWDGLESRIQKGWNYVQSFIKEGFKLEQENAKVDSEMKARERSRQMATPDRFKIADEQIAQREQENKRRADARRTATQAAEGAVAGASRGKRETQARNQQFADLLKQIEGASSLSTLADLYGEFDALSSSGRLSSAQAATLETALEDAQERLNKAGMGGASAGASPSEKAAAGAGAAGVDAAQSKAEVAGTFSSTNLGGMGFGSSLGERQLTVLETIASNTSDLHGSLIAE